MDMTGPMHSISDAPCDSSAMLYAKSRASKVLCLRTRQMRGEARHHRSWEGVVPNVHGAVVRNQSYQLARLEVCCGYQPPQASIPHFVDLHILDLHGHTVALSSLICWPIQKLILCGPVLYAWSMYARSMYV